MTKCCDVWNLEFQTTPDEMSLDFQTTPDEMGLGFDSEIRPVITKDLDYTNAINKPQINGVTLEGNKTNEEILIGSLTNTEIDAILNKTDL